MNSERSVKSAKKIFEVKNSPRMANQVLIQFLIRQFYCVNRHAEQRHTAGSIQQPAVVM